MKINVLQMYTFKNNTLPTVSATTTTTTATFLISRKKINLPTYNKHSNT